MNSGCDKPDPVIPVEQELITTLIYTLVPSQGGESVVLKFEDPDGDGGMEPEISAMPLKKNMEYDGTLILQDRTTIPPEDISEEVEEEGEAHQFFFEYDLPGMQIEYQDLDSDGFPVGLKTKVNTGEGGKGILTITLRHEPDKMAPGVRGGNIDQAGGETDIQVNFEIDVR